MNVHIEHDWSMNTVKLYLTEKHVDKVIVLNANCHKPPISETVIGSKIPSEPSIELDRFDLQILIDALLPQFPPSETLDRHLKDSITVRDRLLTLVEHCIEGGKQIK